MSTNAQIIQSDAKNRAVRTLAQGLALDVAVAVGAALMAWLPSADIESGTAWKVLGLSLAKTVLQAVAAYVMRLKLDGSSLPTPVPPEYPGEPADPVETDDDDVDPRSIPVRGWGQGI